MVSYFIIIEHQTKYLKLENQVLLPITKKFCLESADNIVYLHKTYFIGIERFTFEAYPYPISNHIHSWRDEEAKREEQFIKRFIKSKKSNKSWKSLLPKDRKMFKKMFWKWETKIIYKNPKNLYQNLLIKDDYVCFKRIDRYRRKPYTRVVPDISFINKNNELVFVELGSINCATGDTKQNKIFDELRVCDVLINIKYKINDKTNELYLENPITIRKDEYWAIIFNLL
ncbi:MAG: hypothetical protein ABIC57_04040, partial [bacterium]